MPVSARPAVAVLLVLLAAACGGPTPYQPSDGFEGYSEQALEGDRFRVSFAGNSLTPRDRVLDYLLFRAAELTLTNQHDYFVVVHRQVEPVTRYAVHLNAFDYWPGSLQRHHFGGFGPVLDGGADPITRYDAFAEIKLYKGPTPPAGPNVYDARGVIERLGARVVRPQPT